MNCFLGYHKMSLSFSFSNCNRIWRVEQNKRNLFQCFHNNFTDTFLATVPFPLRMLFRLLLNNFSYSHDWDFFNKFNSSLRIKKLRTFTVALKAQQRWLQIFMDLVFRNRENFSLQISNPFSIPSLCVAVVYINVCYLFRGWWNNAWILTLSCCNDL